MKQSPEDKQIMERMAPGMYCREGFLGTDHRPLSIIVDMDRSTLVELGITKEQITERLDTILTTAAGAFGAPVAVGKGLQAVYHEAMGRIPSPYGDGIFPKGEVELTTDGGATYRFTPLSVHLIGRHGFFQGRGNRYRIEPAEIVQVLGLMDSARKS